MQPRTLRNRILSKITKQDNNCWNWTGRITSTGYGQAWLTTGFKQGTTTSAHRVSYMAFKGEIPENLQIDHLCKNRACVNPDHLEAVTARENVRRSNALWKQESERTHCPRGHEYTDDNTYRYSTRSGGTCRNCRACMKLRARVTYWAKKGLVYAA